MITLDLHSIARRIILIICLAHQLLALFFAFVPLYGMLWVLGLMLELVTAFIYFVYFIIFVGKSTQLVHELLLIFIPVYMLSSFFFADTAGNVANYIIAGVNIVIISVLALITIFTKNTVQNNSLAWQDNYYWWFPCGAATSIIFIEHRLSRRFPFAYYVQIYLTIEYSIYAIFITFFIIMMIILIRKHKKVKMQLESELQGLSQR